MTILDTIYTPEDLKQIPLKELPDLAEEIRQLIVNVVSRTGGHLASSLGAVELAVAIHYVFDAPVDKVIWDVGHQAYAHKILTGRKDQFQNLRQYGGISGFTKLSESPYDAFTTGHSSTSVSAGLGIACAKRLNNDPGSVVAVIGDGSMTAGMAYEGLNQAGDIHKKLIVILNDNDMSIAKNVGALSSFLSRKFSARKLQELRRDFGDFLRSLPGIGDDVYQIAKRSEESFKSFVTPGMLFEAFNFEYFGPIKGHNIKHLVNILNNIKETDEPVLLHVTTVKGKGYPPAEKNPIYFHGIGSFEVETGTKVSVAGQTASYTDVFGDTMVELAEEDSKIVAITAAMPEGTGLTKFAESFPDRFFDVGIAEQHGVTFAAGMATEGLKPVVAVYSTFLQRAYDQLIHDVCIESLPVVFALDRGGLVGEDGPTHHGMFDLSFLRTIPNMVVMAPKDENELRRMLKTALDHDGPIALRYPRGRGIGVDIDARIRPIPIGKAEVLADGGEDILILAIGRTVHEALSAREKLEAEGAHATVVNCRFVKPLDSDLICRLSAATSRVITVEENVLHGGFGSAVLECLMDNGISGCRVKRIGIDDKFVPHGPQRQLRKLCNIDSDAIVEAARRLLETHEK